MAYFVPFIDAAGLHIPTYQDILQDLLQNFRNIYGQNVYLGADSADYQMLSIFALKTSDTFAALQLAYNSRSPLTAVGGDLDSIVKMNGMTRKTASYSTAVLTITGTPGTVITAGEVQDQQGFLWALPLEVTIGLSGSINVTATCEASGAIQALPNTITTIVGGGTSGWTGSTNAAAASPGQPVELDSALRGRQALSVALPSRSLLAGTVAAIAELPGVTRYFVEHNPTGTTDSNGCPAHSITAVVEGGTADAIALAIYQNKTIGAATNGNQTTNGVDADTGQPYTIKWSRPTYDQIYVAVSVTAYNGFTVDMLVSIRTALVTYLNSLQIGETVTYSGLVAMAMSVNTDLRLPQYSVTLALKAGSPPAPTDRADIVLAYDHVAQSDTGKVIVT